MLNPIAQIVQDLRFSLVTESAKRTSDVVQLPFSLAPYLIVLVTVTVGAVYFRKKSNFFAERI